MTASAWKTGHRGGGCAACGGEFAPGTIVVSSLFETSEDDDAPFGRRDVCAACFDAGSPRELDGEPASPPGPAVASLGTPFSWWRSEVPQPDDKKAAFDLGVAREFLVRLLQEEDEERASLRYLLALLLMRKRIVRVVEQMVDERGEVMAFRMPPDDAVHEIVCPEIDETEAETLRDQIGRLFDLGDETC